MDEETAITLIKRLPAYFRATIPDSFENVLPIDHTDRAAYEHMPTFPEEPGPVRTLFLACTPLTFRHAPVVDGLHFVELSADSSLGDIQEGLDANARGFDPTAAAATETEAEAFRRELGTNRAFTAKLGSEPVAAGMFTPIIDGLTEAVGITTLEPYRQRGIGAAVTSEIVRVAFQQGADTVLIRTDNEGAYRIYRRLGFDPVALLLTSKAK